MAATLTVPGKALIRVAPLSTGVLADLGYTIDGIEIEEQAWYEEIRTDENGGSAGPPADVQIFGKTARVRMELIKFDTTVLGTVEAFVNNGTAGAIPTVGSLMGSASLGWRLLIASSVLPRNFVSAFPRGPIVVTRSSKVAQAIIEWQCHAVNGVLWNSTII